MLLKNVFVKKKNMFNTIDNNKIRKIMESDFIKGISHPMYFARPHTLFTAGREVGNPSHFTRPESGRASDSGQLMSMCIFSPHHVASLKAITFQVSKDCILELRNLPNAERKYPS